MVVSQIGGGSLLFIYIKTEISEAEMLASVFQ